MLAQVGTGLVSELASLTQCLRPSRDDSHSPDELSQLFHLNNPACGVGVQDGLQSSQLCDIPDPSLQDTESIGSAGSTGHIAAALPERRGPALGIAHTF